jgi:hypothetical protein
MSEQEQGGQHAAGRLPESERPEFMACVRDPNRRGYSLCGRWTPWEFMFADQQHVRNAETFGSRLVVCPECRRLLL